MKNLYQNIFHIIKVKTCTKPDIPNAAIAPSDINVDIGASYTITCGDNYFQAGGMKMKCTDADVFDTIPVCTS